MTRRITNIHGIIKLLGLCSLSLVFLVSCSSATPKTDTASLDATIDEIEELEEIEEGNDPEIPADETGGPQDCVENDKRPVCNVRPRSSISVFMTVQIKNELLSQRGRSRRGCLSPPNSQVRENAQLILRRCPRQENHSRWFKKPGVYGGGFKLENFHNGLCIERVGNRLRQRTCAGSGDAARNQTWGFRSTPPAGSGDFLKATMTDGLCVKSRGNRVRMVGCQNMADRRWYQGLW